MLSYSGRRADLEENSLNEEEKLKIASQKIQELIRVESFLRGEVKVLRQEINEILKSDPFLIGKKISNNLIYKILDKIYKFIFQKKRQKIEEGFDKSLDNFLDTSKKNIHPPRSIKQKKYDFLFVQLTNNAEIGGVHQLNSIFEHIKQTNRRVESIYLNKDFSNPDIGFNSEVDIEKDEFKNVIFSGLEAFKFIRQFSSLKNAKKINFFQGPDYLFPGNEGRIFNFVSSLKDVDLVLAQSPYLSKIAKYFYAKKVVTITLGPRESVFTDRGLSKEKTVVIPTRIDPDKGLRFALPALKKIRVNGWQVIGYGDLAEPALAINFDHHHGRVPREEVSSLLQRASLVLDLSTYEGLGLSALEAGMCGARSIISSKSGVFSLDNFRSELIMLNNTLDLNEIVESVINYDLSQHEHSRGELVKKSKQFSWERNIEKIETELFNF